MFASCLLFSACEQTGVAGLKKRAIARWGPEETWTPQQRRAFLAGAQQLANPTPASSSPTKRQAAYIVYRHSAEFYRALDAAERSFGPMDTWTNAQRDKYIGLLFAMIRKFYSSDFPGEPSVQLVDDCADFLHEGVEVAHAYLLSHP